MENIMSESPLASFLGAALGAAATIALVAENQRRMAPVVSHRPTSYTPPETVVIRETIVERVVVIDNRPLPISSIDDALNRMATSEISGFEIFLEKRDHFKGLVQRVAVRVTKNALKREGVEIVRINSFGSEWPVYFWDKDVRKAVQSALNNENIWKGQTVIFKAL
jgi:hypothetical protein